jgi:hypothetical protein
MADADYPHILLFRTWGAKQHEGGSESFQRGVYDINKYIDIVSYRRIEFK